MTPEEILKNQNIYFGEFDINGIICDVGYIKKFKWSWLATQMNTFIFVGKTNNIISKEKIETFSTHCLEFALKNNKGWPRGLQSGVTSIAILQGNTIENEAVEYCMKLSKKHWCASEIPVLYNRELKKTFRFGVKPIWGIIYYDYLGKLIDTISSQMASE